MLSCLIRYIRVSFVVIRVSFTVWHIYIYVIAVVKGLRLKAPNAPIGHNEPILRFIVSFHFNYWKHDRTDKGENANSDTVPGFQKT